MNPTYSVNTVIRLMGPSVVRNVWLYIIK